MSHLRVLRWPRMGVLPTLSPWSSCMAQGDAGHNSRAPHGWWRVFAGLFSATRGPGGTGTAGLEERDFGVRRGEGRGQGEGWPVERRSPALVQTCCRMCSSPGAGPAAGCAAHAALQLQRLPARLQCQILGRTPRDQPGDTVQCKTCPCATVPVPLSLCPCPCATVPAPTPDASSSPTPWPSGPVQAL